PPGVVCQPGSPVALTPATRSGVSETSRGCKSWYQGICTRMLLGGTTTHEKRQGNPRVSCTYPGGGDVGCTCHWRRIGQLACYPAPGPLCWHFSSHFLSQECEPLACLFLHTPY